MAPKTSDVPRELLVKGVCVNDVVGCLKRLAEEFAVVNNPDDDEGQSAEAQALLPCINAIAAERIVTHRNKDVRLWAAVCLSEALRIFAPKGCIEDSDLMKSVILLFLEQLGGLANTGSGGVSADSQDLEALVKRLTDVSAFLLLFRCPEPNLLLKELCVTTMRVAGTRPELEATMVQLLVTVLSELEEVPGDALRELLAQLTPGLRAGFAATCVRKVLKTLKGGILPVSLSAWLHQNFSSSKPERLDPHARKDTEDEVLCETVLEIVKVDPTLVARLLPVLRDELRHKEDNRRRLRSTWLVGKMLSHEAASKRTGNVLSNDSAALLEPFLARLEDREENIRLVALEELGKALKGKSIEVSELARKCAPLLADRILDASENVRLIVIQIVDDATQDDRLHEIVSTSLTGVVERIKDKKLRVRELALDTAARVYEQRALPVWLKGQETDIEWIPRLIMEAYATQYKLGPVAHLEGVIERSLLGCGAGLCAENRAVALLGFCTSIYGYEEAEIGFRCMLRLKREAHAALRRLLELRTARKRAAAGGQPLALHSHTQDTSYTKALENFAKLSPSLPRGAGSDTQDSNARFESVVEVLRTFDAVKDKGMWTLLQELTEVPLQVQTPDLEKKLGELDRILRVQNIAPVMMPLLRRALPCTWLLPDQVPVLLKMWQELTATNAGNISEEGGANSSLFAISRHMLGDLSQAFPGAVFPHVRDIAGFLRGSSKDAQEALVVLSRLSKHLPTTGWMPPLDQAVFVKDLVCGAAVASESTAEDCSRLGRKAGDGTSPFCRKVVRSLALLPKEQADEGCQKLFEYAGQLQAKSTGGDRIALHLAAACLAYDKSDVLEAGPWLEEARDMLQSEVADPAAKAAAIEVLAATGAEEDLCNLLLAAEPIPSIGLPLPTHAAICAIRALRHGKIRLTTNLLQALAEHCWSVIKEWNDKSTESILNAMLRCVNQTCSMSTTDKLRFCATLPTMLGLSGVKKYRDSANSFLRGILAQLVAHCKATGKPLADYVTACFVHFLSRLSLFPADVPGYTESSKIATFFCDAMVHNDASKATSISERLLTVVDDMHLFCDKERPDDKMLHLASGVLRYVVERRCPNVVQNKAQSPRVIAGRNRGSGFPAALLMVRPRGASSSSRIPVADAPQSSATPICDGESQTDTVAQLQPRPTEASPTKIVRDSTQICNRDSQSEKKQRSATKLDVRQNDELASRLEDSELPPGPLRMKRPASEYSPSHSTNSKRPATEKTGRSPK